MTPFRLVVPLAFLLGLVQAAELPVSAPEAQGVSARRILRFVEAADQRVDQIHSLVIVRHGRIIAEGYWDPFTAGQHQMLYSLSKSFTSTAVGLAIAEGRLGLYDPVLKFFPDEAPPDASRNLKAMHVRDLLRMESGQSEAAIQSFPYDAAPNMLRAFLATPVEDKPGTFWFYNSAATYVLSAIVQKATGQTVYDYLRPRLFEPLGIEGATWEVSAQGVTRGYSGLRIRTRDIARFGQLYLQGGRWEGRQIVPAAWVRAATSFEASNGGDPNSDWEQGYGFQFWRCRYGAFRGDGAFGQYCVVLPAQDAVVALNSGTGNLPAELAMVWTYLLPAFEAGPLPPDAAADAALTARLSTLQIAPVAGEAAAPADVAGRTYRFEGTEYGPETFTFAGDAIIVRRAGKEETWKYAPGRWVAGPETAYSGAWVADHEFLLKGQDLTLPFLHTYRFTFIGGVPVIDVDMNPHFDTFTPLHGVRGTLVGGAPDPTGASTVP